MSRQGVRTIVMDVRRGVTIASVPPNSGEEVSGCEEHSPALPMTQIERTVERGSVRGVPMVSRLFIACVLSDRIASPK